MRFPRLLSCAVLLSVGTGLHAQHLLPDTLFAAGRPSSVSSLLPPGPSLPAPDLLHMPSPYSYASLGLFCKAELRVNAWFPIPLMVRLGDVQRAEELDGKGVYRSLYAR